MKGVQREEVGVSDLGRGGLSSKNLKERLEVAKMERKPEKEVRERTGQEGQG